MQKCQMISPTSECNEEVLSQFLSESAISSFGKRYRTLSIMGCQSSGKSTLLNLLFGTSFDVMKSNMGRTQTTRGIWVSAIGSSDPGIVLMDVEGTDGKERAESEKAFERRTTLFSLGLADVLMINMWQQDIGRYHAANYALLETVFENNLRLRRSAEHSTRITLLFVIRDHVAEDTPLSTLSEQLSGDLLSLWQNLPKPTEFADSTLESFFDLRFTSLPHKRLQPVEFEAAVDVLRRWFVEPDFESYVFPAAEDDAATRVSLSDLPKFAGMLWTAVLESRDLDLPSQRESLALARCVECAKAQLDLLGLALSPLMEKLREGGAGVPDLGTRLDGLLADRLSAFDAEMAPYLARVRDEQRALLLDQLLERCRVPFTRHAERLIAQALCALDATADAALSLRAPPRGAALAALRADLSPDAALSDALVAAFPPAYPNLRELWELDELLASAREHLAASLARTRVRLIARLVDALAQSASPLPQRALADMPADFWPRVRSALGVAREEAAVALLEDMREFDGEEAEDEAALRAAVGRAVDERLRQKMAAVALVAEQKVVGAFESAFRFDAEGHRRRWRPGMDLLAYSRDAEVVAKRVLDQLALLRVDERLDEVLVLECESDEALLALVRDPELVVLGVSRCDEVLAASRKTFARLFEDAENEVEAMRRDKHVPIPLLLLLLFVGWNELMSIVQSPLYLLLALLIAAAVIGVYYLGLEDQIYYAFTFGAGQVKNKFSSGATSREEPGSTKEKKE